MMGGLQGPRRPYYNPICLLLILKKKRSIFRSSYTISSIIVACETRLTGNGIPPGPNMRMVRLIS